MTQQPFISIIVAIYNVSQYIEKGIAQIINQTFNNFELIIIDDGSTDNSGEICDKLAVMHLNIKVIHQQNIGSGGARNAGIDIATGKYIWFYDVDDCIETDLLSRCVNILYQENPEMLIFSYDEITPLYNIKTPCIFNQIQTYSNADVRNIYVENLSGIKFHNGFVWNKIYLRDFINKFNIRFENQRIQQDEIFNLKIYKHINCITIIPDVLYHYYIYNKGNTRNRFIPDRFNIYKDIKKAFLDLYSHWQMNSEQMLCYIHTRFFNCIIETINFNVYHKQSSLNKKQRKNIINQIFNDEDTLDSIKHLDHYNCIPVNRFKRLYFKQIKNQKITQYHIIRHFECIITSAKFFIRNFVKELKPFS